MDDSIPDKIRATDHQGNYKTPPGAKRWKRRLQIVTTLRLSGDYPADEGSTLQVEVQTGEPATLQIRRMTRDKIMLTPLDFKLAAPTPRGARAYVTLDPLERDSIMAEFAIVPGTLSSIILTRLPAQDEKENT